MRATWLIAAVIGQGCCQASESWIDRHLEVRIGRYAADAIQVGDPQVIAMPADDDERDGSWAATCWFQAAPAHRLAITATDQRWPRTGLSTDTLLSGGLIATYEHHRQSSQQRLTIGWDDLARTDTAPNILGLAARLQTGATSGLNTAVLQTTTTDAATTTRTALGLDWTHRGQHHLGLDLLLTQRDERRQSGLRASYDLRYDQQRSFGAQLSYGDATEPGDERDVRLSLSLACRF